MRGRNAGLRIRYEGSSEGGIGEDGLNIDSVSKGRNGNRIGENECGTTLPKIDGKVGEELPEINDVIKPQNLQNNCGEKRKYQRGDKASFENGFPGPIIEYSSDYVYEICGVAVPFPFEPYDAQLVYMERLLTALNEGKHGILESPTGTGKTLAILCASLAWLNNYRKRGWEGQCAAHEEEFGGRNVDQGRTDAKQKGPHRIEVDDYKSDNHTDTRSLCLPKIIYASRTHSQLKQVVSELKKTPFFANSKLNSKKDGAPIFLTTLLASRDNYCIHSISETRGLKGMQLNAECKKLVQKMECPHYANMYGGGNNFLRKNGRMVFQNPKDIEDLKEEARSGYNMTGKSFCPFFATIEAQTICDLILIPYTYLFDPYIKNNMKLDLSKAAIILDEAHNIPSVAETSASFDLHQSDIVKASNALDVLLRDYSGSIQAGEGDKSGGPAENANHGKSDRNKCKASDKQPTNDVREKENQGAKTKYDENNQGSKENKNSKNPPMNKILEMADIVGVSHLKVSLVGLDRTIEDIELHDPDYKYSCSYSLKDGREIYDILRSHNLTAQNFAATYRLLSSCIECIASKTEDNFASKKSQAMSALDKLLTILTIAFSDIANNYQEFFKVFVHKLPNADRVFSFMCLSPAPAIAQLVAENIHSVVLTSGTLSPTDLLAKELGGNVFDIFLQNKHVIKSCEQLKVCQLSRGINNKTTLRSTFKSREDREGVVALGDTIVGIVSSIPGGVLIFMPSYTVMRSTMEVWKAAGVFARLSAVKEIFVETQKGAELDRVLAQFRAVNNGKTSGAVLIAIFRGRLAEGIDFKDHQCRAVIATAIPFPSLYNPRVSMKKQWLDQQGGISGELWYKTQALRSLNQAIGRVIRHKNDFGAIFLADERFADGWVKNSLPVWVRERVQSFKVFEEMSEGVLEFFANIPPSLRCGVPVGGSPPVEKGGMDIISARTEKLLQNPSLYARDVYQTYPVIGSTKKSPHELLSARVLRDGSVASRIVENTAYNDMTAKHMEMVRKKFKCNPHAVDQQQAQTIHLNTPGKNITAILKTQLPRSKIGKPNLFNFSHAPKLGEANIWRHESREENVQSTQTSSRGTRKQSGISPEGIENNLNTKYTEQSLKHLQESTEPRKQQLLEDAGGRQKEVCEKKTQKIDHGKYEKLQIIVPKSSAKQSSTFLEFKKKKQIAEPINSQKRRATHQIKMTQFLGILL